MELNFNVTGADRKNLVAIIACATHKPAVYEKAPTFNYRVDDTIITKDGKVIVGESISQELRDEIIGTAAQSGMFCELPEVEQEPCKEPKSADNATEGLTVSISRDQLTDEQLENLRKLVEAKGNLIRQSLQADSLPIVAAEDKISFSWLTDTSSPELCDAATHLISAMCKLAREAKRVTAKEKQVDNPKYAFRCFLLRLGFIGDEYKAIRKELLRNLSGSSAFKSKV